ncbi:MAG TPA: 50S ribosomal protein L32 [Phycisphaerae bacterium]|nr:50S ribosomal protein L32 [Phycisphaerae bacterium]
MQPKRKSSKARKRKRRSHHALTPQATVICSHCNHVTLPHRVCDNCGWYQNRQVVATKES